ncbi:M14 family metallopeptidase [Chitinimonas sp.]|uniref:M14 family metallopeptidase n=1 Tax=Chitinimonas sp. TaxID=1934313 RepID=UPI0035AE92DC
MQALHLSCSAALRRLVNGKRPKQRAIAALCALALAAPLAAAELRTVAERSGYQQTGRYAEVVELCAAYQKAYPQAVRCIEFGRTPEGRPMLALIASRSGALTPAQARARHLPVLLMQGGIHSGEIDGKDAGFLALREVLDGKAAKGALERQVLVFVPVFNIDGHERFGRWNRPNQRGPEAMGWRTTAQNLNLNRDYAKADAPEMQAMLRLVNDWDPLAYIDFHVTDGAKFEHDIAVMVEPVRAGDAELRTAGRMLRDAVIKDLAEQGSLPLPFYPAFDVEDDPASGFSDGVSPPRFSNGYFLTRNRFGMLVETHSWKDYPTRVRITRNTMVSLLDQMARHGAQWLSVAQAADRRASALAGKPVPLSYEASNKAHEIAFRGYAYTRTQSEVSGALMTRYDDSQPQIWKVPLRDEVLPALTVNAPLAGYIVPAAHAATVGQKLSQHAITWQIVRQARAGSAVQTFRAETVKYDGASFEGRQPLTVQGRWQSEQRDIHEGDLFVPIAQPKSRLLMALLEPQAPDSLLAWGWFNTAFERKEYMEAYVAEDVAREQLAADPALAKAFNDKLASDPAFAKDPAARLDFFARRHASWDERLNLYPVMRVDKAL